MTNIWGILGSVNYLELLIVPVLGCSACHFTPTTTASPTPTSFIFFNQAFDCLNILGLPSFVQVSVLRQMKTATTGETDPFRIVLAQDIFLVFYILLLASSGKLVEALSSALTAG